MCPCNVAKMCVVSFVLNLEWTILIVVIKSKDRVAYLKIDRLKTFR